MTRRLALGLGGPMRGLPALGRHRLVYLAGEAQGRVALFEVVPGALVTGSAPPGADVSFTLRLHNERGASHLHRTRAQAAPDGRYELRLPYATDGRAASSIRAAGAYRIRCGERSSRLDVSEEDVIEGRALSGPSC
jgi:dolichyl-diphosphooligosaccharide--protein glycosyltransferase